MNTVNQRRRGRPARRGLLGRFESTLPERQVVPGLYGIRIEERFTGEAYVVSAELPGIDPVKDLEVSIADGLLTLLAQRHGDAEGARYSEFRYGALGRALRLPAGALDAQATARYENGVLTVTVPCRDSGPGRRGAPGGG